MHPSQGIVKGDCCVRYSLLAIAMALSASSADSEESKRDGPRWSALMLATQAWTICARNRAYDMFSSGSPNFIADAALEQCATEKSIVRRRAAFYISEDHDQQFADDKADAVVAEFRTLILRDIRGEIERSIADASALKPKGERLPVQRCDGKPRREGTSDNPVMFDEWSSDPDFFCK